MFETSLALNCKILIMSRMASFSKKKKKKKKKNELKFEISLN